MKAIVAVDQHWGIGKDGGMLVHIPKDLAYFKEKTLGKVVIMGRGTLESLPGAKPLKGRETIILSRSPGYDPGCKVCVSLEELFTLLKDYPDEDIFVAGGGDVYRQLMPHCDVCLVTKIDAAFAADTFFENLDAGQSFSLTAESEPITENGVTYRFAEYQRILPK